MEWNEGVQTPTKIMNTEKIQRLNRQPHSPAITTIEKLHGRLDFVGNFYE